MTDRYSLVYNASIAIMGLKEHIDRRLTHESYFCAAEDVTGVTELNMSVNHNRGTTISLAGNASCNGLLIPYLTANVVDGDSARLHCADGLYSFVKVPGLPEMYKLPRKATSTPCEPWAEHIWSHTR